MKMIFILLGLAFAIFLAWLSGTFFKAYFFENKDRDEAKGGNVLISIIVGLVVLFLISFICQKMGCNYDGEKYYR